MSLELHATADRLTVDGELTVIEIGAARDQLLPWVDATETPVIDLSGVTEFDTAGLQMLLVLARRASCRGKALAIRAPASAVREVLTLCQARELRALTEEAA